MYLNIRDILNRDAVSEVLPCSRFIFFRPNWKVTDFHQRLRQLRTKRKLTQTRIAELLGISERVYTRWENGDATPLFGTVVKIADILDVSLDELAGRKESNGEAQIHNPELHRLYKKVAVAAFARTTRRVEGQGHEIGRTGTRTATGTTLRRRSVSERRAKRPVASDSFRSKLILRLTPAPPVSLRWRGLDRRAGLHTFHHYARRIIHGNTVSCQRNQRYGSLRSPLGNNPAAVCRHDLSIRIASSLPFAGAVTDASAERQDCERQTRKLSTYSRRVASYWAGAYCAPRLSSITFTV